MPLAHSYMGVPAQLDRDAVLRALKPILEDPTKAKVGQHAKYDINVLANASTPISVQGVAFDTMLESYVLDSTATRHDMDSLALKYLDHSTIRFEDIAGKGAKQLTFDQIALGTGRALRRRRCRRDPAPAPDAVGQTAGNADAGQGAAGD